MYLLETCSIVFVIVVIRVQFAIHADNAHKHTKNDGYDDYFKWILSRHIVVVVASGTLFNDFLFNVHFFWWWLPASICVLSWCYFYGPTFMVTTSSDATGTAASDTVIAMNGTATIAAVNETRCIVTVKCSASARRCWGRRWCCICHW